MRIIQTGIQANSPGDSRKPLTGPPAGESGVPASSYEEDELNLFAVAAVKVHHINNAYTRKMEEAGSGPEKRRLEQQASGEMVRAVRNTGLTVGTYQAIVSRLKTDTDFAERVEKKIRKVA